MRAELVVNPLMGAFAEEIQIEVAKNRRKAVGIVEVDHGIAEAGAQLVALGAVRKRAGKQSGVMNARQRRRFAMFADRLDVRCLRKERAHHGFVALFMKAEIMKWIGVAALDDRVGLRGQLAHEASFGCWDNIRRIPVSGTRSHSGL